MVRALPVAGVLACLLLLSVGCGDDDDAGSDDGGSGRGGQGGGSSKAGSGGKGGSGGRAAGSGGSGGRAAGGSGGSQSGGDDQQVTIRFKAKVGDEDMACGREYPGQGSTDHTATPQDFRFFVQDLRLIGKDGKEHAVQLEERAPFQQETVALIDFTDGSGHCTSGGSQVNTELTGTVAKGEYDGVVFVAGVPEDLNHQNIALAKVPLQDTTTHWGWQSGYRFVMVEYLPTDVEPAEDAGTSEHGGGGGVASFTHIGSGGCTGNNADGYTCTRANRAEIRLSGFDPESDVIVGDIAKVFEDVDLGSASECHGSGAACAAMVKQFGLDPDTGDVSGEQKVFRVE